MASSRNFHFHQIGSHLRIYTRTPDSIVDLGIDARLVAQPGMTDPQDMDIQKPGLQALRCKCIL